MEEGPFEAVPLAELFPDIEAPEVLVMRLVALALDSARPPEDAPTWYWSIDNAAFPGPKTVGTAVFLSTAVSIGDRSDWTELDIDASWTRQGMREVTASVGVTCFCDVDHGTHYVEQLSLIANGYSSLSRRLERAVEQVLAWLAGPLEPAYWRARAGLPSDQ